MSIEWKWKRYGKNDVIEEHASGGTTRANEAFETASARVGKISLSIEGEGRSWEWQVDHDDLYETIEGETESRERAIELAEWACAKMIELTGGATK